MTEKKDSLEVLTNLLTSFQQNLGLQVGDISSRVTGITSAMESLTLEVMHVKTAVDDVASRTPAMIAAGVRAHEQSDPIHLAMARRTKKTRDDATQRILNIVSSVPPDSDVVEKKKFLSAKTKFIAAGTALIMALTGVIAGSKLSCSSDHIQVSSVSKPVAEKARE